MTAGGDGISRRALLASAAAAFVAPPSWLRVTPRDARTRLILLGTAGGPTPKKNRSAPAQVIVIDDQLYVVDCGDGVARQLVRAGLSLPKLRHIFITHQHSDHNADYGNLLLLAWGSGLQTPVDTWGPPPLKRMTRLFLELNEYDIRVRMKDEGRPPLGPLIRPHEFTGEGIVMRDATVTVRAALVQHPMVSPAFAYRFDAPDRSIVISGDTARSDRLAAFARGADILVHEAMWLPAMDRILAGDPNAPTLRRHLLASHTTAEDCGRVAQAASVKTLVLSHLVPGGDESITDDMWRGAASRYFGGEVIVGRDLMEL
jgi:ribonuclease BN (tRNA processing enzyme)